MLHFFRQKEKIDTNWNNLPKQMLTFQLTEQILYCSGLVYFFGT